MRSTLRSVAAALCGRSGQVDSTTKVAVYWDFENMHRSLHEVSYPQEKFDHYKMQEELVDVSAIMEFGRSLGRVCINRAYCNWNFMQRYAIPLNRFGVSLVQMFPRGNGKNGADIQLCVDLVEDVLRHDVDVCIVVGGDSDFVGAAQKARQYGKRVIGIGVRDRSNSVFSSVCDEFKFYDTLQKSARMVELLVDESGKMTLDAAKQLLVAAISRLCTASGRSEVLRVQIKPMMVRLEPTFDETEISRANRPAGFARFSEFLSACSDVVVVEERDGASDHVVRLRDATAAPQILPSTVDDVAGEYRSILIGALSLLAERSAGPVLVSQLKAAMCTLRGDFAEKRVGARTFLEFLRRHHDVVLVHGPSTPASGDWKASLICEPEAGGFSLPAPREKTDPSERITEDLLHRFVRFVHQTVVDNVQVDFSWVDAFVPFQGEESEASVVTSSEKNLRQALIRLWIRAKIQEPAPENHGYVVKLVYRDERSMLERLSEVWKGENTD